MSYFYEQHKSEESTINTSIQKVLDGNLDASSPREEIFEGLENTTLRKHQKTLMYHMKKLENDSIKIGDKYTMSTNFGVLGDLVGAGKSLPILLIILNNKTIGEKEKLTSYSKVCNVSVIDHSMEPMETKYKIVKTNASVLVVPHTLIKQWKGYADSFVPSLRYRIINKTEHINLTTKEKDGTTKNKYKTLDEFLDTDLFVVSSTFYNQFIRMYVISEYLYNIQFSRVIFDEADSINVPSCQKPSSKFYWFITSSVLNLMCAYKRYWGGKYIDGVRCNGFIKNLFSDLEMNGFKFYEYVFFKNKDSFIESSFELPKPLTKKVACFTPKAVTVLKGLIDPKIIQMIQGDDLKGVMEQIGTMKLAKSADDIIKISTNMFLKEIENKEKEYVYKSTLTYASEESKHRALENIQKKIEEIKGKIKLIESRVQNKFCLVCSGDAEIPTITMCCKNVFCLNCISCSYKENPMCPFCRASITESDICIQSQLKEKTIGDSEETLAIPAKREPKLLNKIDNLFKIIKENPDGKFLVVSQYENSLNELHERFKDKDMKTAKLTGNSAVVNKTLATYKDPDSDLNVILFNADNYGAGLNIPETTDIIIYHKLTKELETQVIGRAQRYPRTTVLRIWYLTIDGEYD
jgi:SNF2 family DNA or RNA helicase